VLGTLLVVVGTAPAYAAPVDFDDLDTSSGNVSLDAISPYQGFTWTNFSAYTANPGFPGFNNGIVSQPNAAFTGGDDLGAPIVGKITVAPGSQFVFTGAYLGSGWYDNLEVTAEGRLGGTVKFGPNPITVNTAGAKQFVFDFTGIDELDFFSTVTSATTDPFGCGSSGCSQFTFDDMDLSIITAISTIAEPSAAAVLFSSIGVFAFGARCQRRRRRHVRY
jgi:hypothetical protein